MVKKMTIKALLSSLLIAAVLLSTGVCPAQAASGEAYALIEEATSSGYAGENYTVRTPADEPCSIYVEGKAEIESTAFLISLAGADSTFVRVFVFPDQSGEFSVKINTAEGNKDYPTAYKGRVVEDETGGQQDSRCYSTRPGYYEIEKMPEGFYRLLITRATSRLHAQGIYDRDCDYIWYDESNPLSGYRGFAAKEFPLYVKNNAPRLVDYTAVRANNTAVRAADTPLREGSEAWTQYTDVYLKDLEWSMNTDGENVPLLAGQVDYLAGVAEELAAGAADDYARLLSFYRYICENFYYDSYAFSESRHACCNPYENLYALRSGSTGLNCINGKVATTCNGYAAMMIALCRAVGIPARMVNGAQLTKTRETWNTTTKDYSSEVSHWWCEAWIDGRWVAVDADRGSCNEWDRSSWAVADDACWKKADSISYAGFDMNDFELAGSYYYQNVYAASGYHRDIPAPTIASADTSSGYVALSWDKIPGSEFYYLFRGTDPSSVTYFAYTKGEDATSYISVDDPEEPERSYYYRVAARKDGVIGTQSNLISVCVSSEERAEALQPPEILRQPASVTAEIGETVSLSVSARNGRLSYQWQYYSADNDAWYNLTSSAFTGIETDTLSVKATLARDGRQYRCRVSNELFTVYSEAALLTVESRPPVITQQPASVAAPEYGSAVFTVAAEGSGLKYKWQFFDDDEQTWKGAYGTYFEGTETSKLTVTARSWHDGMQFRCRISNASGSVESRVVTLTLGPGISMQPQSVTAYRGDTAVFSVKVSGTDVSYQWQYKKASGGNWINATMTGCKTDSLSVPATAARSGYQYRCRIKGGGVTVYSDAAALTVLSGIVVQPQSVTVYRGDTATFTVEAGGSNPSYQWQYQKAGSTSWLNSTLTGSKTDSFSIKATAARDGYRYRCKVTNNGVASYSRAATLTALPLIIDQPSDVRMIPGETAAFTVAAGGSAVKFQWQYRSGASGSWTNSYQDGYDTDTLRVKATAKRDGWQYRCRVKNHGVTTYSQAATLRLEELITAQPQSVSAQIGSTVRFHVAAAGANGLSYSWQVSTDGGETWKYTTLSGCKTDTLIVKVTAGRSGFLYRCKVTNNGVTETSLAATLTAVK